VKGFILAVFLFSATISHAQVTQTVRGQVTGSASQPLLGANVILTSSAEKFILTTDSSGIFSAQVPAQRYIIQISYVGYTTHEQELLVTGGKVISLPVVLEETATQLQDLEVTSASYQNSAGVIDIPIEKALRLPASYFDPLRAAISYPGVVQASDQANSLIIRGASPSGILWRLNGLDILNPNHLANAGTLSDKPVSSGGGVNMLSAQMLDHTRLITSAASANYGNYTSGVMDMHFRESTTTKHEFTMQASLIGLDAAAEGPLSGKNSYLANYRYSTIGLLSQAGVDFGDEQINFQDISFKLSFRGWRSNTGIFGVGGTSQNKFKAKALPDQEVEKDLFDIMYKSKSMTTGVHTEITMGKAVFSAGTAFSYRDQEREADAKYLSFSGNIYDKTVLKESLISSFALIKWVPVTRVSTELGAMFNYNNLNSKVAEMTLFPNLSTTASGSQREITSHLLQPYFKVMYDISSRTAIEIGARYQAQLDSSFTTIDPRASISHRFKNNQWVLSYALASQFQSASVSRFSGKPFRIQQMNLAYSRPLGNHWQLNIQLYHHLLFNVPALAPANFSLINYFDGLVPPFLSDDSKSKVTGSEITVEKRFEDQWYLLAGGSWYDSKYKIENNGWRNTRFNGQYTLNISSGKEWNRKKEKNFGVHLRALGLGGLRTTPIVVLTDGSYFENQIKAFEQKLGDYFRLDARFVWRKNKTGYTRSISLDIQNVLGVENDGFQYYDRLQKRVLIQKQLGIIPILAYRVDF
jgi:hypothetical protein